MGAVRNCRLILAQMQVDHTTKKQSENTVATICVKVVFTTGERVNTNPTNEALLYHFASVRVKKLPKRTTDDTLLLIMLIL